MSAEDIDRWMSESGAYDAIQQLDQLRQQEAARDNAEKNLLADRDAWRARAEQAESQLQELRATLAGLL